MPLLTAVIILGGVARDAAAQEVSYTDNWTGDPEFDDSLPAYGVGVTEEPSGYTPEKVVTTMYGDGGAVLDSEESSLDYYYVAAYVGYYVPWADPDYTPPANCSETVHWRYLLDYGYELVSETLATQRLERFQARWIYNRQLPAGDYEYLRSGANCNGLCETVRMCYSVKGNWLKQNGWIIDRILCVGIVRAQDTQPPCKMPFGTVIADYTGCSS